VVAAARRNGGKGRLILNSRGTRSAAVASPSPVTYERRVPYRGSYVTPPPQPIVNSRTASSQGASMGNRGEWGRPAPHADRAGPEALSTAQFPPAGSTADPARTEEEHLSSVRDSDSGPVSPLICVRRGVIHACGMMKAVLRFPSG